MSDYTKARKEAHYCWAKRKAKEDLIEVPSENQLKRLGYTPWKDGSDWGYSYRHAEVDELRQELIIAVGKNESLKNEKEKLSKALHAILSIPEGSLGEASDMKEIAFFALAPKKIIKGDKE